MSRRKSWLAVFKDAASKWSADQVSRLAASLAYFTVFSIAPLILIAISAASLFFGDRAATTLVSARVQGWLGPDKARALQQLLLGARQPAAGSAAGLIGFALLLSGASGVVAELQASLNQVFGARVIPKSLLENVRRRAVALGFVLCLGGLLLLSLALNAGTAAAGAFLSRALGVPEVLIHAVNQLLSFSLIAAMFAGMFRLLPDARLSWGDLGVGAAFTAALFTLGNAALGLYLGKAGGASAYGAAGSIVGFLLWTYYCAQIVYFGAEFTNSYAVDRGRGVRAV